MQERSQGPSGLSCEILAPAPSNLLWAALIGTLAAGYLLDHQLIQSKLDFAPMAKGYLASCGTFETGPL